MTAEISGTAIAVAIVLATPTRSGQARLRLAGVGGSDLPGGPAGVGFVPVPVAAVAAGPVVLAVMAGWPLPLALIPALVAGVAWWAARTVPARRRRERMAAGVPEAAGALAAELRAGAHPSAALAAVAEVAPPLADVLAAAADEARHGGSAARVLRATAEAERVAALGHLAAAWAAAEQAGAGVADVLERLAAALDAEQDAAARMRARLAGPRATVVLLAALPALGVGLGQAVGADPLGLLVSRPLGWALCAAAVVLDALGVLWTARIVRGVTGAGRPQ